MLASFFFKTKYFSMKPLRAKNRDAMEICKKTNECAISNCISNMYTLDEQKCVDFNYYLKKFMTYTMLKKTPFKFPTERYLNVVRRGYRDCKLNEKYLKKGLQES